MIRERQRLADAIGDRSGLPLILWLSEFPRSVRMSLHLMP